jgi:hypothetical protein
MFSHEGTIQHACRCGVVCSMQEAADTVLLQQQKAQPLLALSKLSPWLSCRGLTAHQAGRFLQLQRLQVARQQLHALDESEEEAAAAGQEAPVESYPISVSALRKSSPYQLASSRHTMQRQGHQPPLITPTLLHITQGTPAG